MTELAQVFSIYDQAQFVVCAGNKNQTLLELFSGGGHD